MRGLTDKARAEVGGRGGGAGGREADHGALAAASGLPTEGARRKTGQACSNTTMLRGPSFFKKKSAKKEGGGEVSNAHFEALLRG